MIKKDIFDKDVKAQFKASAKDRVHRFMLADKTIKGAIVHSTKMINEMQSNHELGPLETLVLGQAYIAASLLSAGLKDKSDRLGLNVQCSGPIKGLDVETNAYGEVRGYLKTEQIEVEDQKQIKYLSTLFGAGFLTITKYLENTATPYSGQIALEHGSIAEDLANYFLISEQIPTGFKLSLFFDENEQIRGAGGIFLQALPGADPLQVEAAEKMIQSIDSLGELLSRGETPEEIINHKFEDLSPVFLNSNRVEFFCRCSKQRMYGYIKSLGIDEKKDIVKNGPFPMEVRCHHCNSTYQFSKTELENL